MSTDPVSGAGSSSSVSSSSGTTDAFNNLDLKTFINLLVTEMQTQDPMNPMDNSQILQQISQISSIESSRQLNTTLEAVLTGQNVATASSLIGRTITGLADDGQNVTGKVDSVTVADGAATLHVGASTVALKNVAEILPAS